MLRRLFGRKSEEAEVIDDSLKPLQFSSPPAPVTTRPDDWPMEWSPSGTIRTNRSGDILLRATGASEARLALKELKLQKKAVGVQKRSVTQQMASIRREYAAKNARRGPSMRGGGDFGKFIRAMDQTSRASDRRNRERELEPYEARKRELELAIHNLDQLIHYCDMFLHDQQANAVTSASNDTLPDDSVVGYWHWLLVEYGLPFERVEPLSNADAQNMLEQQERGFVKAELEWWNGNASTTLKRKFADKVQPTLSDRALRFPFVRRPHDYVRFAQQASGELELSRFLIDRGLEVCRDPITRHYLFMTSIDHEIKFELALDPTSQQRLQQHAFALRENRDEAIDLMLVKDGMLPPNRGEAYDPMPYLICERRIAAVYRSRNNDPTAIERTKALCRVMIERSEEFLQLFADLELPLPEHKGFQQLAIILDKEGDVLGALEVSRQADDEGWSGDWDKRIERYANKAEKLQAQKDKQRGEQH